MILREQYKQVQIALGTLPDGIPGRKTDAAYNKLRAAAWDEYLNQSGWGFTAEIDGDDIVVKGTTATWFGGDNDPLDNGETASGIMTKGNPDLMGCALPVLPLHASTSGSPLAFGNSNRSAIPWKTPVEVTCNGLTIPTILVDNGPAKSSGDGIDLTVAAFLKFAPIKQGVIKNVDYRIIGGAKFATV